ncbi:hypothetical protein JX266_010309 [Neoarthrinium moseri]|uniref:uncharacterized protein n=1 Tax=Neoarthrinium moseri TaxID=1658444 RepID=UPI001FDCA651|nr:uncharacterized protein JN550_003556 [Neoarthrinium moseri]KAI1843483.1 hypothetical protein JX266_010309 [Neoarthrinium moseri]KAI1873303.1 hypothetical protein JN550_003556 [Neoarthrinium moseri]
MSVLSPFTPINIKEPSYQTFRGKGDRSNTPPPAPKTSAHYPADLRPTILTAQKHPDAVEVVKQVNEFFLQNWPFRTEKHRRRFVDEGFAWFVCLNCPLSLDERMHWGCRLLTIGFLIDDLLDSMSVQEGVAYNSKVIECARGSILPDRDVPGQWIMYDLFEGMRAVDKQLADELLAPTIDFLWAQVDGNRIKPMTLNEYFDYRDADLGKGLLTGIMRFCAGLYMTAEELALVKDIEKNAMKHITFVNDICSFEKEELAAQNGFELGALCSSVPIVMDMYGVNRENAIRIMWETVRVWEVQHFEMVEEIRRQNPSPALAFYCKGLERQTAGNELWSLLTPRYNRSGSVAFTEGR